MFVENLELFVFLFPLVECFFFSDMRIDKMDKIESIVPNCPSGLCISRQDFLKPEFSVDNFFIEQSVKDTPLDTLRDDLGIYLKVEYVLCVD